MSDLICLVGRTYEGREYDGIVLNGRWYGIDDVLPPGVSERIDKTLQSGETNDAPIDVIQDGVYTQYYYRLLK